jgi:hypothetical protein
MTTGTAYVPSVFVSPGSGFGCAALLPKNVSHVSPRGAFRVTTSMKVVGPGGRGRRLKGDKGGSGGGFGRGGLGNGGGSFTGGRGASGGAGGPGSLSGDKNPLSRLTFLYADKLKRYPIITKALTSLFGFGMASLIIEGKDAYKKGWQAVALIAAVGGLVHGVGGHYYYNITERAFPGSEVVNLGAKVAVDFVLWLPIISHALSFARDVYRGKKIDEERGKSILENWTLPAPIWLVYSGVIFKFAAVNERTAFYNAILVFTAIAKMLSKDCNLPEPQITTPKK